MSLTFNPARMAIERPAMSYSVVAATLAAAALSPVPAPIPLIGLVGILRLASQQLAYRHQAFKQLGLIFVATSTGAAALHIPAAINATSSGFTSVLSVFALSMVSSVIPFTALFVDARMSTRFGGSYTQIMLFPAIWASAWALASLSPVGRLFAWSPVSQDMGSFAWLARYGGPWAMDWIIAAGAVIFSHIAGTILMGDAQVIDDDEQGYHSSAHTTRDGDHLITFEDEEHPDHHDHSNGNGNISGIDEDTARAGTQARTSRLSLPSRRPMWLFAALLLALSIPSYFVQTLPLSPTAENSLSITVGCALPGPVTGGHPPQFEDFVNVTKVLSPLAKIVIWPEGAIRFESLKDRKDKIAIITSQVLHENAQALIGIGFEESLSGTGSQGRHLTRNGFLLLGKDGVVHEYYKRNLVPIAESFKMVASTDPPTLSIIDYPIKKLTKGRWRTEPLTITSGICMDFASAAPFSALEERPSLILAPARTWHQDAGGAMWAHARSRAAELGAPALLWCDGGEGGFSGVAGSSVGKDGRLMRAGQGSWVTEVVIPMPAEKKRTVYARTGDWGALAFVWGLVAVGAAADGMARSGAASSLPAPRPLNWVKQFIGMVQEKRRQAALKANGERTPLLVDA